MKIFNHFRKSKVRESNHFKICMLLEKYFPRIGGSEKQARILSRTLARLGLSVMIVTGRWKRAWAPVDTIDDIPVYRIRSLEKKGRDGGRTGRMGKVGFWFYFLNLLKFLKDNRKRFDLIHVHQGHESAFIGTIAGRILNKPVIVKFANTGRFSDYRGLISNRGFLLGNIMWSVIKTADRIVVTSSAMEKEFLGKRKVNEKVIKIPNGVDLKEFSKDHIRSDKGKVRNFLGIPDDDKILVIFAGKFHIQKGIDILIQSWKNITDMRSDVHLLIAGEGYEKNNLKQLITKLDLAKYVTMSDGWISELTDFYYASDIFVLPSRTEGMPNVLLEAMACSLPVVATNVSGSQDIVQNGINGFLVAPENQEELTFRISELIQDKELRKKLGNNARQQVEKVYDIKKIALSYRKLYQSLLIKN